MTDRAAEALRSLYRIAATPQHFSFFFDSATPQTFSLFITLQSLFFTLPSFAALRHALCVS